MPGWLLAVLRTLNELLTAGIAITAFSLLLYAFSFNLRDRVSRSFAMILVCVVVAFSAEALASASAPQDAVFWLRLEWVGILFLPPAYLHFSDALLATTGRPSRGRRRWLVRLNYWVAALFLAALPFGWLVGPLVDAGPAAYLQRQPLFAWFTLFYVFSMAWALANFIRGYRRSVTGAGRRRMVYLLAGASAPAMGSFPYLILGAGVATAHPLWFWLAAIVSNSLVAVLLVLMSYTVAFFGVTWPDRLVKTRLFKWLLRGAGTAFVMLALTTLTRRLGEAFGFSYSALVPVVMVVSLLLLEYLVTLAAPYWERALFHGGDREQLGLLQSLEERLLTAADLHQFLEALLAAVCDRLQVSRAFVFFYDQEAHGQMISVGDLPAAPEVVAENMAQFDAVETSAAPAVPPAAEGMDASWRIWDGFWLLPLFDRPPSGANTPPAELLGLLGFERLPGQVLEEEQQQSLALLAERAGDALRRRREQQRLFSSLRELTPQMAQIQRLRAAARYDGGRSLAQEPAPATEETSELARWVKDALTHYWGGPKLVESPLLRLQVVQDSLDEHEHNPANALRALLKRAIEQVRPEGERRFTAEWMLYNILEMKFLEGRKVREVALRLAMSEADLYRKQRTAIEAVARAIQEMEQEAGAIEARPPQEL
jgi:hypothetical protein